jgi:hypothetical protein
MKCYLLKNGRAIVVKRHGEVKRVDDDGREASTVHLTLMDGSTLRMDNDDIATIDGPRGMRSVCSGRRGSSAFSLTTGYGLKDGVLPTNCRKNGLRQSLSIS